VVARGSSGSCEKIRIGCDSTPRKSSDPKRGPTRLTGEFKGEEGGEDVK
jgi:hypothetical protein